MDENASALASLSDYERYACTQLAAFYERHSPSEHMTMRTVVVRLQLFAEDNAYEGLRKFLGRKFGVTLDLLTAAEFAASQVRSISRTSDDVATLPRHELEPPS